MSFAKEFSLQPELVPDVIEELLEADIICKNQVKMLKHENRNPKYDPNILMDVRHEQIRRRSLSTLNENKTTLDRRPKKPIGINQINHLQVDREIENFRKELEIERKKLYELTKLSNEYKKTNRNKSAQPIIPVTNVVTQRKVKISEISTEMVVSEKTIMVQSSLEFKKQPIEVLGYKPLSITQPVTTKVCLNEDSPFCPHKSINEKRENKTKTIQKESNDIKDRGDGDKNSGFFFGGNNVSNSQQNNVLVSKTIDKWKTFVTNKPNRCCKEERLLKIKLRKYLLRKYWDEWVIYHKEIKREKEEQIKQKKRTEKINLFFEKLEAKRKELSEMKSLAKNVTHESEKPKKTLQHDNGSVFTNRLNAQKSIIQEQKEKLKEQDKIIQQLKEVKLKEEMKEFKNNLQNTIQETVKNFNSRLKPKVRQLALQANVYKNGTEKIAECNFVKRMNERAQERKEKWKIIRIQKQLIEEEKQRKILEEEERKREEEERAKRKKIREKKEQIRMQREMELKRQLDIEIMKEKMSSAEHYYHRRLLRKTIAALKHNVYFTRKLEHECEAYYNRKLLKKSLKQWKETKDSTARSDTATANAFYSFNLLNRCLTNWKLLYSEAIQKQQVAEDFYDAKLLEKAFIMWRLFTNRQYIMYERQTEKATVYYNRNIVKKYFKSWKQLPKTMYNVREEEKRIRAWREKIIEIIPDFKPELIYNDEDETTD